MRIRPIELRDAARTAELLNSIIATGTETSMSESLRLTEQEKYIVSFPTRGVFLVAEEVASGLVIGMQSIEPCGNASEPNGHVAEISTFVDAASRRSGVGSALMEALCINATKNGFRKLLATIRADNTAALHFYTRSGFRQIGILRAHLRFRGKYLDQVLAERLLNVQSDT